MSTKELLYIEDAVGHAKALCTQCRAAAQAMQDTELKAFAEKLADQQQQLSQSLLGLL